MKLIIAPAPLSSKIRSRPDGAFRGLASSARMVGGPMGKAAGDQGMEAQILIWPRNL
jgi:hypothetical protein